MDKNTDNGMETENIEIIEVEEKTIVFYPLRFILKLIVSIAYAVHFAKSEFPGSNWIYLILETLGNFGVIYAVASLFGLLLNLTRNYLVAIIMFIAAIFGYVKLYDFIQEKGLIADIAFSIVMTIIMIAVIVRDIRNAILYFKYNARSS